MIVLIEIQVKGFLNICRKVSEMKKIVCDKMIHALVRITLAACDSAKAQNYDPQVIHLAAQCLGALAGKYDRKKYIPGQTRDQDKVRDFLINQGEYLPNQFFLKRLRRRTRFSGYLQIIIR